MSLPKNKMRQSVVRTPGRYAVLLNARAKGWRGSVHQAVQRYVPNEDLFLTDSFHQAKRTVERLVLSDYDVIFTGGGDGTIVYLINQIEQAIREGRIAREDAPPVGVLRLGTGNAIATYLGCDDIIEDLRALRHGAALSVHEVNMLEGPEGLFPFAGLGWDADILNDYEAVKNLVRDTAIESYATGLGGYAASIMLRTIPNAITQPQRIIKIYNLGDVAKKIDYYGRVLEEFGEGELLYEGPAVICSASSIPYWGFQVRMFPRADHDPQFFQLRAYFGSVRDVLTKMRDFWRGKIAEDSIVDLLVQRVRVEVEGDPVPYQVSGDTAGLERSIEWALAPHPARLAVPLPTSER